jgi:hypothetical protein
MTTIAVSGPILRVLRSALLSELGVVGEEIERATTRPDMERHHEWFEGPVERFDAIREVLDPLGWSDHPTETQRLLALDPNHATIVQALEARLSIEREYADVDEDLSGAGRQREVASGLIAHIENFLAGLPEVA